MSLELSLTRKPDVPLEADVISPDVMAGLSNKAISALEVFHGNEKATIGDFFTVKGDGDENIILKGDLTQVKLIGANMSRGRISIRGNAGLHLGAYMSGGEITVAKNAGDWVGPEMTGGRIVIKGNAGHLIGSAYRGSQTGILGGEIFVHGNVGNEAGNTMKNGLIVIGGNCGDFAGVNMKAGTIIVLGHLGQRCGAGMRRGSIVSMNEAELPPTFTYACDYNPSFLRVYLRRLREEGFKIDETQITGRYKRWSGDSIEMNRGEVLMLAS